MTLSDFMPYVLPHAKGCPDIVAQFNVRLAVIELCQKAMIWREYQAPVATVDMQTAYGYELADGQQAYTLLSMKLDGVDVDVIEPAAGKLLDSNNFTGPYAYGTFTGFELHPAQGAGRQIVTFSTVAPSINATTIPDSFSQYMEDIATGALSRLLATKGKDYSDATGALAAKINWDSAIASAKSDALTGFSRAKVRTAKVWF